MGRRYVFEGRVGVLQFSRVLGGVNFYWFIPDIGYGRQRAYVTLDDVAVCEDGPMRLDETPLGIDLFEDSPAACGAL